MNVTLLCTRSVLTQPLTAIVCPNLSNPSSGPPLISTILNLLRNSPTFSPPLSNPCLLLTSAVGFSMASPEDRAPAKVKRHRRLRTEKEDPVPENSEVGGGEGVLNFGERSRRCLVVEGTRVLGFTAGR